MTKTTVCNLIDELWLPTATINEMKRKLNMLSYSDEELEDLAKGYEMAISKQSTVASGMALEIIGLAKEAKTIPFLSLEAREKFLQGEGKDLRDRLDSRHGLKVGKQKAKDIIADLLPTRGE